MELAPLALNYHVDFAELQINSDINEASALGMEKALELFFGYYHYPMALLRINSNGGQVPALTHMIQTVDRWRKEGRQIQTEATFRAGSAAALLLSLGEVGSRSAQQYSALLYHHTRVGGTAVAITAGGADHLASVLQSADRRLVTRLAEHVAAGFRGPASLAAEGGARCELLQTRHASINDALEGQASRRVPKWLRSVVAMYRECAARDSIGAYIKVLARRFEQDTPMDLCEAYALGLIDGIAGVSDLPALASVVASDAAGNNALKLTARAPESLMGFGPPATRATRGSSVHRGNLP